MKCVKSLILVLSLVLSAVLVFGANVPEDMSSTVDPFCEDSDGLDFYGLGVVSDADGNWTDHCSANFLIEYTCEGLYHDRVGRQCEYGCADGACNNPPMDEDAEDAEDEDEVEEDVPETEDEEQEDLVDTEESSEEEENISRVMTKTDLTALNLTITKPRANSIQKYQVMLNDTDPYEMTHVELVEMVAELATSFDEEPKELLIKVEHLRPKGRLNEEIDRIERDNKFTARMKMGYIRKSNPSIYDLMQRAREVNPFLLETEIEVLQQNIALSVLFEEGEGHYLTKDDMFRLHYANDFNFTNRSSYVVEINLTDQESKDRLVAVLVVNATEEGNITSMQLISEQQRVLVKSWNNRLVNIKTGVEISLTNFTEETAIVMVTYSIPDKRILDNVDCAAREQGLNLIERVGMLDVYLYELDAEDVLDAKIVFNVENNLFGRESPETGKMFSVVGKNSSLLTIGPIIADEEGYLTFKADLKDMSKEQTFSMFLAEDTESTLGDSIVKTILFVVVLVVAIAGAILAFSIIFSRLSRKKRDGF